MSTYASGPLQPPRLRLLDGRKIVAARCRLRHGLARGRCGGRIASLVALARLAGGLLAHGCGYRQLIKRIAGRQLITKIRSPRATGLYHQWYPRVLNVCFLLSPAPRSPRGEGHGARSRQEVRSRIWAARAAHPRRILYVPCSKVRPPNTGPRVELKNLADKSA
jgi:hypothetical protein